MGCDGKGACSAPLTQTCSAPDVCNVNTDGKCGRPIYVHLAVGEYSACAVVSDGTLRCWGDNSYGELGLVGSQVRTIPVPVPGVSNARTVTVGWLHGCALLRDGQVDCWGYNCNGSAGCSFDSSLPHQWCTPKSAGSPVAQISAGSETSCVRLLDGTVECWGRNDVGQTGDGTFGFINHCGDTNIDRFDPVTTVGIRDSVDVVSAPWHGCAVVADGSLRCWGKNSDGQLGTGDTTAHLTASPVVGIDGAGDDSFAVSVTAAAQHTCALMRDGSIRCFGLNTSGQLGVPGVEVSLGPVLTHPGLSASFVAAGYGYTCAVVSGSVACWGSNGFGQLGGGTFVDSPSPVVARLPAGVSVATVHAKHAFTCALSVDGRIFCWGQNYAGQLGIGTTADSAVPVEVAAP